ncbi:MAG: ATP12 family protein [Pseudomonadota bacterium]
MTTKQRFYKTVTADILGEGFGVFLDDRKLVTPAKKPLIVANLALAQLIGDEWEAQSETINTATMPITRLVNVAIDRTPNARAEMAQEIKKFASTDLLCYRTSAPQKLAQKQDEIWNPILEWAKQDLDLGMAMAIDSLDLVQSDETLNKVEVMASELDDLMLTLLAFLVPLCGSAILGFALLRGQLSANQVFEAIRIEENHNAEIWGHDYEDLDKAKEKLADLVAVERILAAIYIIK